MAKAQSSDLPHNLIGFVGDPLSEQAINKSIKAMAMAYSEVSQGNFDDIIAFLKNNRSPKILIMDISDSELPLDEIAKIKELSAPNISIVAVGSKNDVGLFRDLQAIGVVDYLIKPLNEKLLQRAIEIANGGVKEYVEKTGKMIQFISSVGGAGATTASTNVGWILANRHFKRAAILDMDFMYGTVNLMLDIKVENSYLDIMESPDKIDDYFLGTIFKKYDQRLYYLGGLIDLLRGPNINMAAFETLMDAVKKQFNYIIIDSQRDLNDINKICMKKSDIFVVMVEMSVASAQNAMRMLEFLSSDQPGKRIIIVANKVGLSIGGALGKESFEKIIDRKVDCVMPLDESVALAAANIGQPLAMSDGLLTDVLEKLTDNIIGKVDVQSVGQEIASQGFNLDRIKELSFNALDKLISRFKR
jgi:pilus assembly protein CpaE